MSVPEQIVVPTFSSAGRGAGGGASSPWEEIATEVVTVADALFEVAVTTTDYDIILVLFDIENDVNNDMAIELNQDGVNANYNRQLVINNSLWAGTGEYVFVTAGGASSSGIFTGMILIGNRTGHSRTCNVTAHGGNTESYMGGFEYTPTGKVTHIGFRCTSTAKIQVGSRMRVLGLKIQ